VEAETIHLKRMGLSFDAIAEQITRVGWRQAQPIAKIPDGVTLAPDFQISRQACHKAFKKAVARGTVSCRRAISQTRYRPLRRDVSELAARHP
jgi:hypothetical protein